MGGNSHAIDLVQQIKLLNEGKYLHEVVHVDNKADFCIGGVILKHLESPLYFPI
jgi:methylenetetrahydrofolate reductase (NADPH)